MSVQAMTWVWLHAPHDLTSGQMVVALAVADHAHPDGTEAWPTVARLSAMCRLSESAVQRALAALVEKGVLGRELNAGGSRGQRANRRPNLYTVLMDGVASTLPQDAPGVASTLSRGRVHAPQTVLQPSLELLPTVEVHSLGFDDFWDAYPRKIGRLAAVRAWDKAIKIARADVILAGVQRFAYASEDADPKFIPHPATWLNAGRWADEVNVRRKPPGVRTRLAEPRELRGMERYR